MEGGWLCCASSAAPLQVWLAPQGEGYRIAVSDPRIVEEMESWPQSVADLPEGAKAVFTVPGYPALYATLRRAYALSRALPTQLLDTFRAKTRHLPATTEAERLVVQRVGQDVFRAGLLDFWDSRCAVTGLDVPGLLRASHMQPWAECASDAERLDVYNGLLLAPHLDALFDGGWMTFDDEGKAVLSPHLPGHAVTTLRLPEDLRITRLREGHRRYLEFHRGVVFR
jgi:predicted restriction endonuclease